MRRMHKWLCWMLALCLMATLPVAGAEEAVAAEQPEEALCEETLVENAPVEGMDDDAAEEGEWIALEDALDEVPEEAQADAPAEDVAEDNGVSAGSALVQDFCEYADGALGFGTIGTDKSTGASLRRFTGRKDQMDLVKGYVNRLAAGGYNFTLNHIFNQSYRDTFWSATLNYTGGASVGTRISQVYDNGYSGDMMVYFSTDGSSMSGYVYLAKGLKFADLGLRSDGSVVSTQPAGASWNAKLKVSGGKYCTSDGRFKVSPGKAVVYRDGKKYSTKATMERDAKGGHDKFRIYNFYRNEGFALQLPYQALLTGDRLTRREMGVGSDWAGGNMETFFAYTMNYIVGACHAGEYHMLQQVPTNGFKDAYLRVMRWNRKVAVLYLCAEFDTAPHTVECMAVFQLNKAGKTQTGTRVKLGKGRSRKLSFGGRESDALSEVYRWEVVSGGKCVSLSGTSGQTCTVKAKARGTARVRVTYDYSVYGSDVLTGNRNYEFKSKTEEFVIKIS